MFRYTCCFSSPLASERAATDRGPMGSSNNGIHLMISPWQTVPLHCVNPYIRYDDKQLAHRFIRTPRTISLKGCPGYGLRPIREASHTWLAQYKLVPQPHRFHKALASIAAPAEPRRGPDQVNSPPIRGAVGPLLVARSPPFRGPLGGRLAHAGFHFGFQF